MAYRTAKCIELHDLHMEISLDNQGYYVGAQILRSDQRPAFKMRVEELLPFLEAIGIAMPRSVELSYTSDQSNRAQRKIDTEDIELNIYAHHGDGVRDWSGTVLFIECEVLSAHLVNIRITVMDEDESQYVEEITYSGTFTIWWMPIP